MAFPAAPGAAVETRKGDFPMITFIQFLITGLRLGSVYALIALGYTMVY